MRRRHAARTAFVLVVALAVPAPGVTSPEAAPIGSMRVSPLVPSAASGREPVATGESTVRQLKDQPDASDAHQTHAIYFVPKGGLDEALDTNGVIAASLRSIRAWFSAQSGKQPRIDMLAGTRTFDITYHAGASEASAYTSLRSIANELVAAGFTAPTKRYLVYAALNRGETCGEGYFAMPGLDPGRFAAVYLNSNPGCGARDLGDGTLQGAGMGDAIAVHEWLHNEGAVPIGAPRHCVVSRFHVCTGPLALAPDLDPERTDLLFPYATVPLREKVLDIGRDDYFGHELPTVDVADSPYLCEPPAASC